MGLQGLKQFNNTIEEAQRALKDDFGLFLRRIALEAWIGITERNRVLTGRSRANWQLTIDNPYIKEIDGPADAGTDFWDPIKTQNLSEGQQKINSLRGESGLGRTIFIGNTVDYIFKLEGWDAMVKVTMERLNAKYGSL